MTRRLQVLNAGLMLALSMAGSSGVLAGAVPIRARETPSAPQDPSERIEAMTKAERKRQWKNQKRLHAQQGKRK